MNNTLAKRLEALEQQAVDSEPYNPPVVIGDLEPGYIEKVAAAKQAGRDVVLITTRCGRSCPDDRHCQGQHGCRHKEVTA